MNSKVVPEAPARFALRECFARVQDLLTKMGPKSRNCEVSGFPAILGEWRARARHSGGTSRHRNGFGPSEFELRGQRK
eukprot:9101902-Alexandrium_andersonii.AAC.1